MLARELTFTPEIIKVIRFTHLRKLTLILGECYANEEAFKILCRLKNIEAEEKRALIPHGFEHIVTDSHNRKLEQQAYEQLLAMKSDPSENVRDEVEISLQRIVNKGIKLPF